MHRLTCLLVAAVLPPTLLFADDPPKDPLQLLGRPRATTLSALSPSTRPFTLPGLTHAIEQGFKFLENWQSPNGSWDRIGEVDPMQENDSDLEWRLQDGPHHDGKEYRDGIVKDLPESKENENVADTALAARSMLLAVTSGRHPEYVARLKKSIEFLCNQVDTWNGGDKVKTIRIQKRFLDPIHDQTPALGECRYYDSTVDTFFTLSFLAQARDRLTDDKLKARIDRALHILQFKIESTQDVTGTWFDDADPLAKINDQLDPPPHLTHGTVAPNHPRVSPENPRLPEGSLCKAEPYDLEDELGRNKNILVHCQYVRDLSIATRLGVPFKTSTLWNAQANLQHRFVEAHWDRRDDGPYAKNVSPKALLITAVVAAWYQADLTAHALLDQAQKQKAAGEKIDPALLDALTVHAQETRAQLESQVRRFIRYDNPPICGPALENLADALAAVELFDKPAAKKYSASLATIMLTRQRAAGNFIAGPNDDWRQYEWIGSDRGESIFGTSTTLPLLLYLEKHAADPAATQPSVPRP